jgi:hypothetical protein
MNYQIENRGPHFAIITNKGKFAGVITAFGNAVVTVNLVGGMAHAGFRSIQEAQAFVHAL